MCDDDRVVERNYGWIWFWLLSLDVDHLLVTKLKVMLVSWK